MAMETEYLDRGNFSDEDDVEKLDLSPFHIDWLDLAPYQTDIKIGMSSLPGCKFKTNWRSVSFDIKCLKDNEIEDVFCLLTKTEFHFYRVQKLIDEYTKAGLTLHHHPIEDGMVPTQELMMLILEELKQCVADGKKILMHCFGGLGRTCLVATCFYSFMNPSISMEDIREKITQLRGASAKGSIKQYNLINDFPTIVEEYKKRVNGEREAHRSESR